MDLTASEPNGVIDILSQVDETRSFANKYDLRRPLGIYNISIQRVDQRLARAAKALEAYSKQARSLDDGVNGEDLSLITDTLESCIYAAAEHVDDLESCLLVLFKDRQSFAKSAEVRRFKRALSSLRRNISAYANAIKHAQARVRLFRFGFLHDHETMVLTGFFIEGVKDGSVGPSKTLHGSDDAVISISSFLWEVIVFVHHASDLLATAVSNLLGLGAQQDVARERFAILKEGIPATAKLPLVGLDGPHPFDGTSITIAGESVGRIFLDNDLYGSLGNRWTKSRSHGFAGATQDYVGDGITRSFKLAQPKVLRILHWQ